MMLPSLATVRGGSAVPAADGWPVAAAAGLAPENRAVPISKIEICKTSPGPIRSISPFAARPAGEAIGAGALLALSIVSAFNSINVAGNFAVSCEADITSTRVGPLDGRLAQPLAKRGRASIAARPRRRVLKVERNEIMQLPLSVWWSEQRRRSAPS